MVLVVDVAKLYHAVVVASSPLSIVNAAFDFKMALITSISTFATAVDNSK